MSSLPYNHWIHQNSILHSPRSRRHKNNTKKGTSKSPSPLARALFRLVQVSKIRLVSSLISHLISSQISLKTQISNLSFSSHSLISHSFWDSSNAQKKVGGLISVSPVTGTHIAC